MNTEFNAVGGRQTVKLKWTLDTYNRIELKLNYEVANTYIQFLYDSVFVSKTIRDDCVQACE